MPDLNSVFLAAAILSLFLGFGALFMPGRILGQASPGYRLTFQKLGAAALATGLLAWWARGLIDPTARSTIALFLGLYYALSAALTLLGLLRKESDKSEWLFAGLDGALALAFFLAA